MRILLTLLIFTTFPSFSQNLNLSEWMKFLPDTTPLCHLAIPGTHDSGALDGGEAFQTQDLTIEEQLEAGIRCFDIRLKACDNQQLGVYHSIVFQDAYWETDVLPAFRNFLKHHPSEALIVLIKREGGDPQAFAQLLAPTLADSLFVPQLTPDITLAIARGRILLIHRDRLLSDFPGAQCHGWKDNATFTAQLLSNNGQITTLSVEDEYQFASSESADYKAQTAWQHLQRAQQSHLSSEHTWHLTFASATALPGEGPLAFATPVNQQLARLTTNLTHPCGILLIDYAGTPEARAITDNLIRQSVKASRKK